MKKSTVIIQVVENSGASISYFSFGDPKLRTYIIPKGTKFPFGCLLPGSWYAIRCSEVAPKCWDWNQAFPLDHTKVLSDGQV